MTNSDKIIECIESFYTNPSVDCSNDKLKANHLKVIKSMLWLWADRDIEIPREGQKVLAIQDLRSFDKGAFVGDYYFEDGNFVANLGDSDPYGNIRFWVGVDTLDALPLNPLRNEPFYKIEN